MQEGTFDATLQLLGIDAKKNKNQSYRYECAFSDNTTKVCFDADMARSLGELVGGPAFPVRYTVRQSPKATGQGFWTNISIDSYALPGDELPFNPNAQSAAAPAEVAASAASTSASTSNSGSSGSWDDTTTARVSKLSVIGHAAFLVGNLYQGAGPEALEQALVDVKKVGGELYKLARSHEKPSVSSQGPISAPVTPETTPTPSTPAEVAAAVPGVVVGTSAIGAGDSTAVDWD